MKHAFTLFLFMLSMLFTSGKNGGKSLPYQDPELPVETRVEDLLSRMTLEEKVAQLSMTGLVPFPTNEQLYAVCETPFAPAEEIAELSLIRKRYARDSTRLGIPFIQSGECLHGLLALGTTVFPQAIAQGATWNPQLVKQMGEAVAEEASSVGVDQALSPLFDLIRDPRYGRNEECYGEDPYLVSEMGTAFVCGMQGDPEQTVNGIPEGKIACVAKHFAGYSFPIAGINVAPASIGERDMRTYFLPPFEKVVKAGNVYGIMPSYNEVDGMPAHANKFLIQQVLRDEWGFKGYVFSDYMGLWQLADMHKVEAGKPEAALRGLRTGVDMEAPIPYVYPELVNLVREGKVDEKEVDRAVRRVLTIKFKAGLFEKALPDPKKAKKILHSPRHQALAKQMSDESVVLLQNNGSLLPLSPDSLKSLAVIGPNADQVQFGDYSCTRDNAYGVTVLEGIRSVVGDKVKINYAKGCNISGTDRSGFAEAVKAAQQSDAVVAVLGETSVIFSNKGWGQGLGANEPKDPFVCGEGYDVSDISPTGVQRELLQELYKTGKPIVLVLVHGRPWAIDWEKEHIPAILEAWYPGEKGGESVADIIFGKVNPSGRLNCSVPRSSGHIPVFYNYKPTGIGVNRHPGTPDKPGMDYVFSSPAPLYPFGHGLSYTTFEYGNLKVTPETFGPEDRITVTVDVTNSGGRAGKEVVQLYVNDPVSSVTTPVKQLRRFEKIALEPGESRTVAFTLDKDDFALWNDDMERVTEPGTFIVMIGRSAEEIVAKQEINYNE